MILEIMADTRKQTEKRMLQYQTLIRRLKKKGEKRG